MWVELRNANDPLQICLQQGGGEFSSRIKFSAEMQGHAVPRGPQVPEDEIKASLGAVRLPCLGPWLSAMLWMAVWMTKDILRILLLYCSSERSDWEPDVQGELGVSSQPRKAVRQVGLAELPGYQLHPPGPYEEFHVYPNFSLLPTSHLAGVQQSLAESCPSCKP